MAKKDKIQIRIPDEAVINKIYVIGDEKVMLDNDLAELYGVTTGNLNKAVKRNIKRFPKDFMFQLTKEEHDSVRFQIGSLKRGVHSKYLPYVFTEQGVAMLSGVLSSDRAVQVNIQIMRVFTKMRKMLLTHKDLLLKMEQLEKKVTNQDEKVKLVFEYLKQFIKEQNAPRKKIGFR